MKVPKTLPVSESKYLAVVQDAILLASNNLDVKLTEIDVRFPTLVDDFDMMKFKIYWRAKMIGLPVEWKGYPIIAGRLYWPEAPENETITMSVKRSTSFAILVGLLPERSFVYRVLEAYRCDQEIPLVGLYKMECAELMDKAVSQQLSEYNNLKDTEKIQGWKPKLPSIAKTQQAVIESMQKRSVDWLKDIYAKMKADIEREFKH
jgi:hypothetical protein